MTNEEIWKKANELHGILESELEEKKAVLCGVDAAMKSSACVGNATKILRIGFSLNRKRIDALRVAIIEVETLMHEVKS